jgi:hypothetical protein
MVDGFEQSLEASCASIALDEFTAACGAEEFAGLRGVANDKLAA